MLVSRNLLGSSGLRRVVGKTTAGGLGVLTSDSVAVEVTQTSMLAGLLHALDVVTKLGVQQVGVFMMVLAVLVVLLSVEEPLGESELGGVGDHVDDLVHLLGVNLTGTLGHVDVADLADQIGETATDTLDS